MARTLDELPLRENERAALRELRDGLGERFGERLVKLVLYGSKARGDGTEESDLDVMAVIRDLDRKAEREALSGPAREIGDRHRALIEMHEYSEADWEERLRRQWPFHAIVEAEGIPLIGSVSGHRPPMTRENRRHYAEVLMGLARRSLDSAAKMLTILESYHAVSQEACIAILRAADAMLGARDAYRPKFRGVVAGFEEEFVKTGDVGGGPGSLVRKAWRRRILCTYDVSHQESREEAEATIERARTFLDAAEERLRIEGTRPVRAGGGEGTPA